VGCIGEQQTRCVYGQCGSYKIALIVGNFDYHWLRQNPEGSWSHKRGLTEVINYDAKGQVIYDPSTANFNYSEIEEYGENYHFITFIIITPPDPQDIVFRAGSIK